MDINRQLNVLCEVTKTLQGQINKINDIMGQLIQRVDDIQQPNSRKENFNSDSEKNTKQQSEIITVNETAEEQPVILPGTMSYSEAAASDKERHQNGTETKRQEKAQTQAVSSKKSKNSESTQSKPVNKYFNKPIKTVISRRPTASKTLIIGDYSIWNKQKRFE